MSLTIASQTIGFISFAITLMTLLGVYRDLISTMRTADTKIPIVLGNLRQELEEERALLRYRCRENDQYGIFPSLRKRTRKQREVSQLLQSTIEKMWQEFKSIERPFLIKNAFRAEQVKKGDYWGDSDLDEKPRTRAGRGRDRADMAEAGLPVDAQQRYYRTDVVHRFIWWQSRSAVVDLLDQVQRIQIRRIERDVFEADELVKRCLDRLGGKGGRGRGGSGSGSGSSGSRGGGGSSRRRSVRPRSGSANLTSRRGSAAGGHLREMVETEVVRRRPEGEASNTGRQRKRSPQPRYEYEIVQPGRIVVDVEDSDAPRRPRIVPTRSYSRKRGVDG